MRKLPIYPFLIIDLMYSSDGYQYPVISTKKGKWQYTFVRQWNCRNRYCGLLDL